MSLNYQRLTIVGNAKADAQRKTSKKGDVSFTTFSLGVRDAKDEATYFPVTVFGQQAEAVAKYVTKGKQLLVEGRVVRNKDRFNVVANRVHFGASVKAKKAKRTRKAK